MKEPAPLADYSIGEEISASAPIAIAWSQPGLAKHRRCALAALTANLVLSIWSADGKPKEGSSWDRRLIINNALSDYFMAAASDQASHITSSFRERMRLKSRIRAFTWAPALPSSHTSNTLGSRVSYGQHMVAVCNEDNQLALVVIQSPNSTYGVAQGWNAKVLTHTCLDPDTTSTSSPTSFFDDMMRQQRHISHVSWSPWVAQGTRYRSIIVYATNEDVRARVVAYKHDEVSWGDEIVYPQIMMRYNGPIKWCPTVSGEVLTLALFTFSGLICLSVSIQDASIIDRATHDLDGRWDPVSGAVWDAFSRSTPRLHFSSLLSTIRNPTAVLETRPGSLVSLGSPSWRDQIENSAVLFSVKNDLKGNSKMKVWGLATSPLGDFIASCHSVHPSDMIEYGSPNDRRGTVAVSALRQYREMRQDFPARDVSAEGILFTLKKLVENTVEDSDQMPAFTEEIAENLLQAYHPLETLGDNSGISSLEFVAKELNTLVQDFKRIAFFDRHTLKDRYTILASQACNNKMTNDLQRVLIASRLAFVVQALPLALSSNRFSAEIRAHHQRMIALVQNLVEPDVSDAEPAQASGPEHTENGPEKHVHVIAPPQAPDKSLDSVGLDFVNATVDTCDFCTSPIPFTDLTTASCTNGHQFPRCGLSFVAIQAPGITKYCGICSTPFLNDEFVSAQETHQTGPVVMVENGNTDEENGSSSNGLSKEVPANSERPNVTDAEGDISMGDDSVSRAEQEQATKRRLEQSRNQENQKEPAVTLAKMLYLACDVCIYCGGKFVG
jgi:hypothetical protein